MWLAVDQHEYAVKRPSAEDTHKTLCFSYYGFLSRPSMFTIAHQKVELMHGCIENRESCSGRRATPFTRWA